MYDTLIPYIGGVVHYIKRTMLKGYLNHHNVSTKKITDFK